MNLGLVTCSSPINSLEVFQAAALVFASHMVETSLLSVPVRLCPFGEHVVSINFYNFEFSIQLGEL